MSIVDRFEMASRRMAAGYDLTTSEAALLLAVSTSTVLRLMHERAIRPTVAGGGRRPASWAARDVESLLVRVEVDHAPAH